MYGAAALTTAGLALLGYYNFKVTGNALQLPYELFNQQYMAVRNFMVHPMIATPPVYRHAEFQMLYEKIAASALLPYQKHPWWAQVQRLGYLWNFYCGNWALSLPLLAVPFACTNKRIRWAAVFLLLFMAPMALVIPVLPHYYAAAAGLWTILLVGGLHRLRFWNPQGRPTGSLLSRVAVAALVVIFVKDVIQKPPEYTSGPAAFKSMRRDLIAQLNAAGQTPGAGPLRGRLQPRYGVRGERRGRGRVAHSMGALHESENRPRTH